MLFRTGDASATRRAAAGVASGSRSMNSSFSTRWIITRVKPSDISTRAGSGTPGDTAARPAMTKRVDATYQAGVQSAGSASSVRKTRASEPSRTNALAAAMSGAR